MQFAYTAKSRAGEAKSGLIEAGSLHEARELLHGMDLFLMSLGAPGTQVAPARTRVTWRSGRVHKSDLLMFTSQMLIMLQSGLDLSRALETTAEYCRHAKLKQILEDIHRNVTNGQKLSDAMERHRDTFGGAYVASVRAGEQAGTITEVLARLISLLRNEIRMRNGIRSALSYPIVLCGVASLVLSALVLFVLPQFSKVFEDLGSEPPMMTRVLLDGASWLRGHLLIVGAAVIIPILLLPKLVKADALARLGDRLLLKVPILRTACRTLLTGRTFRLTGMMLESGIPLLDSLRLCRDSIGNRLFRDLFTTMEEEVLVGRGISGVLRATDLIPHGAAQMIATAEHAGRLGAVMQTVGEFFEEEGETLVRNAVKIAEPVIIILMGIVVSVVVMAVMLPLLDVSTASH